MRTYLLIGFLFGCGCTAALQSPPQSLPAPESALAALALAQEALQSGDSAQLLWALQTFDALAPAQPRVLIYLARAYVAEGRPTEALQTLERLAAMGAVGLGADTSFASLADYPDFMPTMRRMAANAAPLIRSDTVLVVGGIDRLPESIAYDPQEALFYIGSLAENTVVRVTSDGQVSDFASAGVDGQVTGIKVDPLRRQLWVNSAGRTPADPSKVLVYELTGEFIREYTVTGSAAHLVNDVAIAASGEVFVTDTEASALFRIRPWAEAPELLVPASPRFHWPNGIALSRDGQRLYVAHLEGISLVDPESGHHEVLPQPLTISTAGIDGLYACSSSILAIQQMHGFYQVIRFDLSTEGRRIVGSEVLERRHPAYDMPTTGVIVDDALLYIANSQIHRREPDGTVRPTETPAPTVILRLPLSDHCV